MSTDMQFKKAFDNLTKEENLLLPDEEGMSKQELIEEFKNRMGYIDEAVGQMHHLTNFRPATKKRLQERGNKAKSILRQEISRLENEMKAPKKKKKKKKVKYDEEGKLTPEEISFILSPESSFNVEPESLQRGGKRKTRRKKKTKKRRRKSRRKTRKRKSKRRRKLKKKH